MIGNFGSNSNPQIKMTLDGTTQTIASCQTNNNSRQIYVGNVTLGIGIGIPKGAYVFTEQMGTINISFYKVKK